MNRDEIRKLAELVGWTPTQLALASDAGWAMLERFAPLVAEAEREACAKVCEDYGTSNTTKACAQAIRARSTP